MISSRCVAAYNALTRLLPSSQQQSRFLIALGLRRRFDVERRRSDGPRTVGRGRETRGELNSCVDAPSRHGTARTSRTDGRTRRLFPGAHWSGMPDSSVESSVTDRYRPVRCDGCRRAACPADGLGGPRTVHAAAPTNVVALVPPNAVGPNLDLRRRSSIYV